jgi:hypothetical protein
MYYVHCAAAVFINHHAVVQGEVATKPETTRLSDCSGLYSPEEKSTATF